MKLVSVLEEHEARKRKKDRKKQKRDRKKRKREEEEEEDEEEEGEDEEEGGEEERFQKRSRTKPVAAPLRMKALTKKGGEVRSGTPRAGDPLDQARSLWKRD